MSRKLSAFADRMLSRVVPKSEASACGTSCTVYSMACAMGGSVHCDYVVCYDSCAGVVYSYCSNNCMCIP